MHEIALTDAEAGQRLDRYLRKLLRHVPLAAIFRHLRQGDIRVDGRKAEGSLRLLAGMTVRLHLPAADLQVAAATRRLAPAAAIATGDAAGLLPRIVLQDSDLLVVAKPAGLAAQPGSGQSDDLASWLDRQSIGTRTDTFKPAPAHRLDRGTSGLVAIGLSPDGLRGLTAAFRGDAVRKVYLAVVHGVPEPACSTIDAPLWQRPDAGSRGAKMVVDARGKPARTDYEVMTTGRERSLLRLVLHTGRQHQIRAHLQHLGHPIVGDQRYGSPVDLGYSTFLLHAAELAFAHPCTGELVHCVEDPPPLFRQCLDRE
ncbi:MAG TPA: RluA family pseudouridine synthase [Planctomycetota bacterium]|nr:RluA family pseudouridine synthase [Planctomycetota bacterium]